MNFDWLKGHCSAFPKHMPRATREPWSLVVEGGLWLGASDGRRLIAVRPRLGGDASPFEFLDNAIEREKAPRIERERESVTLIRSWLASPGAPVATSTLAELRAWCGAQDAACASCAGLAWADCAECNGAGGVRDECDRCSMPHDCACRPCNGDGKVPCGACRAAKRFEPGVIAGVTMNRALLRRSLEAPLADGLVALAVGEHAHAPEGERGSIRLIGPSWFVILMGLSGDRKTWEWEVGWKPGDPVPVFGEPAPAGAAS